MKINQNVLCRKNVSLENEADLWPDLTKAVRECVDLLLVNSENSHYVIDERVVE